jgi:hypothetical protein
MEHCYQMRATALCEMFVDAARRDDKGKRLKQITRAIQNYNPRPHDPLMRLRQLIVLLKDSQTPPRRETPILTFPQILRAAFPRHEFLHLSNEKYRKMLVTYDNRHTRRLVKQIGLQLAPPGRPKENLDK